MSEQCHNINEQQAVSHELISVAVMQPYFFPYLPYFQLISAVDIFVFFDDVQYIRRGWINRNRILIKGEPHTFTVPVTSGRREDLILEKRLAPEASAQLARIRTTFANAYAPAPFCSNILELFDRVTMPVRTGKTDNLIDLLIGGIEAVAADLKIATQFMRASAFGLPRYLKGEERILAIAHQLGANRYLNSIGGVDLYDSARFRSVAIELGFVTTDPAIQYPQINTRTFVPSLSIIDVLANIGPKGVRKLLGRWKAL